MPILSNISPDEYRELIPDGIVLLGYRGSIAHGTYINPEHFADSIDDKDIMGIAIPGLNHYFGLNQFCSRDTHEKKLREWDSVTYEIHKFVSLLYQSNPNVLSLLWLEPHHYIVKTEWGTKLIEARSLLSLRKFTMLSAATPTAS